VMHGQGVRAADYTPLLDTMSDADNRRQLDAVRRMIGETAVRIAPLATNAV